MRPSLQPYLASKSAFTVAASRGSRSLSTRRAMALNSASPIRTLTCGYGLTTVPNTQLIFDTGSPAPTP
jgi:hypothetical protein